MLFVYATLFFTNHLEKRFVLVLKNYMMRLALQFLITDTSPSKRFDCDRRGAYLLSLDVSVGKIFTRRATLEKILKPRAALIESAK